MLQRSIEGVMGTELFLPFEIFTEEKKKLDSATDVYALGMSMYVTFTGTYPYGKEMKELMKYLRDPKPPVDMRKYNKKIPKDLDLLCYKMIQIEREGRIDDAGRCYRYLCDIMKGKKIGVKRNKIYKVSSTNEEVGYEKNIIDKIPKVNQKVMIALGLGIACMMGGYMCK